MLVATSKPSVSLTAADRQQLSRMLPALRRQIDFQTRSLHRQEREEFAANAVGLACEMFQRLIQRGRAELAYPVPLASYACRQVRAGRQCGTSLNVRDISSPYCQNHKGVRGQSLHYLDPDSGQWQELVVEDRQASPADVAATRIDFQAWLKTLTCKNRQVAEALASGESAQVVAKQVGISGARISQLRRELKSAWEEFQGQVVPMLV